MKFTSDEINQLPRGWLLVKLEEVVDRISNGITQRQTKNRDGLPVTRIETISNAVIDLTKVGYLRHVPADIVEKYRLLEGDILFSHINSDTHLGKSAIFNIQGYTLLHGMNLLLIRPNKQILVSEFLNYLFNYYRHSGFFISIAQHAVNQASINQTKMKGLLIPLAPLNEQRRIVARIEALFSRLDAGVEALRRVQAQLKRYRQAVLKSAFEGKLTEEWRRQHKDQLEPAEKLLERIKQEKVFDIPRRIDSQPSEINDLPEIPAEWKWTHVGLLAESMKNGIYKPKKFYSSDGIACLRMYNIDKGTIVWKDIKRMNLKKEEIEFYELKPGDILVNRVNSRELVGKAAVIPLGLERCVYESKNIRLRLLQRYVSSMYANFWFLLFSQRFFSKNAQQTVGMASINQEQLALMPIPYCHPKEQNEIVEKIEKLFSIADEVENAVNKNIEQTNILRQGVLRLAFEGRLVPQDPSDEPAEKLLERIRAERAKAKTEKAEDKPLRKRGQMELTGYV